METGKASRSLSRRSTTSSYESVNLLIVVIRDSRREGREGGVVLWVWLLDGEKFCLKSGLDWS